MEWSVLKKKRKKFNIFLHYSQFAKIDRTSFFFFFHFPFQIPLTIPYAKCLHPLSGDIPKVSILSIPLERNSAKVECHEQKLLMPAG